MLTFMVALTAVMAFAPAVSLSSSGDDTPSLPAQRLRDHKCFHFEKDKRILLQMGCSGSFSKPNPTPIPVNPVIVISGNDPSGKNDPSGNCTGICVRGPNLEPFSQCLPERGSECTSSGPRIVKIKKMETAGCVVSDRSCVCGEFSPLPPNDQREDIVIIQFSCGG